MKILKSKKLRKLCLFIVGSVLVYFVYQWIAVYRLNSALDDLMVHTPDIPITEPAVPEGAPVIAYGQKATKGKSGYWVRLYKNLVVEFDGENGPRQLGKFYFRISRTDFIQALTLIKQSQGIKHPKHLGLINWIKYLYSPMDMDDSVNWFHFNISGVNQEFTYSRFITEFGARDYEGIKKTKFQLALILNLSPFLCDGNNRLISDFDSCGL